MLKKIAKFAWWLFMAAAVLLGAWVVADNTVLIDFHFLGFDISQQTLGLVVVVAFAMGLLLGLVSSIVITAGVTLKLKRLQRRLQRHEPLEPSTGRST